MSLTIKPSQSELSIKYNSLLRRGLRIQRDVELTVSSKEVHNIVAHCVCGVVVHILGPSLKAIPDLFCNVDDLGSELIEKLGERSRAVSLNREGGVGGALDIACDT